MSALRRHWLPSHVWLGTEASVSQGPIVAFRTEEDARAWASVAPDSIGATIARRIWVVAIPDDASTFRVVRVPATTAMDVDG